MITYTGYIRNIRFYSEETKFIVALIEVEQEDRMLVMNGYMSDVNEYNKYTFVGDYKMHPKYGEQFVITSYEVILAKDSDEIVKYLSSPLFKGIGRVQAQSIVDALGEQCLDLIKEDKSVLQTVRGINEKKIDTIYTVLTNDDYDQEVMRFFMGHGISLRNLALIQAVYKEKTLTVLQDNPYQMIEDIDGIGFQTADDLAMKIGCDRESPNRLKAAILYSIKQGCFRSGSSYQSIDSILRMFRKQIINIEDSLFYEYLETLIEEGKVMVDADKYYDKEMYEAEVNIASFISNLQGRPEYMYDENSVQEEINAIEKRNHITYAKKQKQAITYFLSYPCMVLTGGPGTGKTTVIQAILAMAEKQFPESKIALVAPTGRAAKRLSEVTGRKASTIHRLLKWDLHTNTFALHADNPMEEEILIIDEFSMVDCLLFSRLLEASRYVKKILCIGDHHQLPSVAPGNVLKDFMAMDVKTIELDEIFRQAQSSGIIQLAHHIIHNEMTDMSLFKQYQDIHFCSCPSQDVAYYVSRIVAQAIEEGYTLNEIQVLAPMYQGIAGIDALNKALQKVCNEKQDDSIEMRIGNVVFREGDKILQLKNRPEDEVYNGDIGILVEINKKDNVAYLEDTIVVDFDGAMVEYTAKTFSTFTHAYCTSIHKSQGSEFKIVILCVLYDYRIMLRRNLLYTGLTRAKQSLFILGQSDAFLYGIENNQEGRRKTSLATMYLKNAAQTTLSPYDFMEEG